MVSNKDFFEEQSSNSHIKTEIVNKYFKIWAKIIGTHMARSSNDKIIYLDLFSGPGIYGVDKVKSTPLLIMDTIVKDDLLSNMVQTVFNDSNKSNIDCLKNEIESIPDIKKLKFAPKYHNEPVESSKFNGWLKQKLNPMFLFADPWGYTGLSLELFKTVLSNFGCEVIMFFNYNRINAALSNSTVEANMRLLFGDAYTEKLIVELKSNKRPHEREAFIIQVVRNYFKQDLNAFVSDFKFYKAHKKGTSHHIIHITKHPLGFLKMKEVMHGLSSTTTPGITTLFEHNPTPRSPLMKIEFNEAIEDLAELLISEYSGKEIGFIEMFDAHQKKTLFIEKHYRDAMFLLQNRNQIVATPTITTKNDKLFFKKDTQIKFN